MYSSPARPGESGPPQPGALEVLTGYAVKEQPAGPAALLAAVEGLFIL